MRRHTINFVTLVGLILLGFVVGLAVLQIGTGYRPAGIVLVSHDCEWEGDCGGQSYDGQWSNEDENRNRNRNRGSFSPGPFDRSPVDAFNGNTVCLPGSTCYGQPDDRRQDEER